MCRWINARLKTIREISKNQFYQINKIPEKNSGEIVFMPPCRRSQTHAHDGNKQNDYWTNDDSRGGQIWPPVWSINTMSVGQNYVTATGHSDDQRIDKNGMVRDVPCARFAQIFVFVQIFVIFVFVQI